MNCPHCNIHIDEHGASRCLDAWMAEAVMGWKVRFFEFRGEKYWNVPHYSTQMADSWEAVELFRHGTNHREDGRDTVACCINLHITDAGLPDSCVEIYSPALKKVKAYANNMPLAFCRAAIKAS